MIHVHGPDTVLVRTTGEEVGKAAGILAGRANRATGPVAIVIPKRGFSAVDIEGQHFYDPDADAAFAQVVRETVNEGVDIVEIEAHINDSEFAAAVVDTFNKLTRK
jgi:uncharacterized protein (UPF0261 family)